MTNITTHSQLHRATATLLAAAEAMPRAEEVERLREKLAPARDRGYFTPDEEAEIRRLFSRYLHVRGALHQTLRSMRPMAPRFGRRVDRTSRRAFVAAWLSGCMLMRAARFMEKAFHDEPMTRKLLNQAEPAYNIPPGTLDAIHASATRPHTLLRYFRAARCAELRREELEALRNDPLTGPLLALLDLEQPFIETQKRRHAESWARCRVDRWRNHPSRQYHKVMWGLFEASGRAIAEMRNPLHRKRVSGRVRRRVGRGLLPGDLLVTRHDDALSNLFLPGFWPHAALVIGHPEQRLALGADVSEDRTARSQRPVCVLEAKKDGVRFRSLRETLSVDAFVWLRPRFTSDAARRELVERALSHEGKLYDFEFDFTRADRLVCTEVVYRSIDGVDGLAFQLIRKAGRFTLPAEDLLRQALASGRFDVVEVYGLRGNQTVSGPRARELLERSLETVRTSPS